MFGRSAATRSPLPMPKSRNACCRQETRSESSRQLRRRSIRSSPRKTIAADASFRRRRFSAKLSSASGKKHAPGMRSPSTMRRPPFSPTTPQKSQTSSQKAARSAIDQAWSSAKPGRDRPLRVSAALAKAVSGWRAIASDEGTQSGGSLGIGRSILSFKFRLCTEPERREAAPG